MNATRSQLATTRICKKCLVEQDILRFPILRANYRRNRCRDCSNKYEREYRKHNVERVRARERSQASRHREERRVSAQRYRDNNRELVRAKDRERYAANREKRRESSYRWRRENPERARASQQAAYYKNQARNKEYQRKYRKEHPGENTRRSKEWRAKHPERTRERAILWLHRRRARKAAVGGTFTIEEFKALCRLYNSKCLACGLSKKLTADHVVPLLLGGSNFIENIQPLCGSCNSKKHLQIIDYRLSKVA